jgi:hypothetical protein
VLTRVPLTCPPFFSTAVVEKLQEKGPSQNLQAVTNPWESSNSSEWVARPGTFIGPDPVG